MLKGSLFKKAIFLAACLMALAQASAQDAGKKILYYYGVVTNVNDQNMLNITQDLFFAQLRGVGYLETLDKRDDEIKEVYNQIRGDRSGEAFFSLAEGQDPSGSAMLFVARIFRPRSDEKWSCSFFVKNLENGGIFSRTKEYDSYYKIVTDAKVLIQSVVAEAAGNASFEGGAPKAASVSGRTEGEASGSESLAGNWSGEQNASKIILLRSGRGFIVFNNGATMNLTVIPKDGGTSVRIVQRDKFNASFYPDIDRQTILNYADSASPIEWNLTLSADGSLVGKKKTLAQVGSSVEPASVDTRWTKK